jgi:uncharacterized membrane protein
MKSLKRQIDRGVADVNLIASGTNAKIIMARMPCKIISHFSPQEINMEPQSREKECLVCKKTFPLQKVVPVDTVRESLLKALAKLNPGTSFDKGYICEEDLNKNRKEYFKLLINEEKGDLTEIENSVFNALHEQKVLTNRLIHPRRKHLTFGERLSDTIAEFGGSWTFIILFIFALAFWIVFNSSSSAKFDPYPFILLNLFLSCLAALQAPIIMMSQNRQQQRDRERQVQDYKINLKSEVEIRILNEKMDKLLSHQWQRLLEIQEMQMDLMEEMTRKK